MTVQKPTDADPISFMQGIDEPEALGIEMMTRDLMLVSTALEYAAEGKDCTQIDRTLRSLKLPTTSTLMVSEENIVSWMAGQVKEVVHRINIWVNRVYASFMNLDKKVKAEIEAAAAEGRDHDRHIPIPKVHMVVGIAAIAAATVGIIKLTKNIKGHVDSIRDDFDAMSEPLRTDPASPEARAREARRTEARQRLNKKEMGVDNKLIRKLYAKGSPEMRDALQRYTNATATPEDLKNIKEGMDKLRHAVEDFEKTTKTIKTPAQAKAAAPEIHEIRLITYAGLSAAEQALRHGKVDE